MVSQDPIIRGGRWKAFYNEDGGLKDMFAEIRGVYLDRLAKTEPHKVEHLQILALAHKVTQQVEDMVTAIIHGAEFAQAAKEHTSKIQAIPEAKRRRL